MNHEGQPWLLLDGKNGEVQRQLRCPRLEEWHLRHLLNGDRVV